jgi:hypothetical protein
MDVETNSAGKQGILASSVHGRTLAARTWFGRTRCSSTSSSESRFLSYFVGL